MLLFFFFPPSLGQWKAKKKFYRFDVPDVIFFLKIFDEFKGK